MTGGTVVVLGHAGHNFAAGMSGGIAYVYDVRADFESNCNTEMVDIDPLSAEDAALLRGLLEEHVRYTGSKVAAFLLGDFENQLQQFKKVFPKDYKKVLANKLVAVEGVRV
jgi:glutamate synthase (NADPH/NADH) large chain